VHFLDRVGRTTCEPIAISTVLEVRLENRFQNELGGGLNYPIPDRRDAERAFSPVTPAHVRRRRSRLPASTPRKVTEWPLLAAPMCVGP
jgi:hypothetical protein